MKPALSFYDPYFAGKEEYPLIWYPSVDSGFYGGSAVVAGYMYRGCEFPRFQGYLFFSDFMGG